MIEREDRDFMHEPQELRRKLVALIDQDSHRRHVRDEARDREQRDLAARRDAFERVASRWIVELVQPRLETLVELLPATGVVEWVNTSLLVSASFPSSAQFPVVASLTVTITPIGRYQGACVEIKPLLIPMLQGHPPSTTREFDLTDGAAPELAEFLDRDVVAFARSYLHVRDPDSPYQLCGPSRPSAEESQPPAATPEPAVSC